MSASNRRADLASYYDAEALAGTRSELTGLRRDLLDQEMERLRGESIEVIADVGAGPGRDTGPLAAAGWPVIGIDLSFENARRLDQETDGVAVVASLFDLPLLTSSVDAVWTMSTLVHVPDAEVDAAMAELVRVVRPGGLLLIGSWGGRDWEGTYDFTRFDPPRFFSHRAHDRWRSTLARHGDVERYDTFVTDEPGWEYQFAVLRR